MGQLGDSKAAHSAAVGADASTLLRAVAAVVASSEQSFVYKSLDPTSLPSDCGERCKEKKAYVSRLHALTCIKEPSTGGKEPHHFEKTQ